MEDKCPRASASDNWLGRDEMTCDPYTRKMNIMPSSGKFKEDKDVPLELIIQILEEIVNPSRRDCRNVPAHHLQRLNPIVDCVVVPPLPRIL